MADDTQQQQPQPFDLNAALQAAIQAQIAAASGQTPQVQLPSLPAPQAQTQYSNDPSKGPDLLERIGLALGGGSLPGAPAELRAQMGRQALMNFGIGLMSAGKFATPGEVLAGGLRGAQGGLLGSEAAQAGQQEYALNAQGKLLGLGIEQQKARTEALNSLVSLEQMRTRLGLPPLFGGGAGGPGGGGPGGDGGDTALTGDMAHDQPIIAQRESGGNPHALNYVAMQDPSAYARGATASGKYQFVNSTWQEGMKLAGIENPQQYPTAMSAPEAVQDQVFKAVYGKYGTAPWDASKFTSNWVAQPGGGYQLVKGAPPPASGPGSAVGPYKVAGPVVAPPSAPPASSALPEPPQPPPGAVPTVSTSEEASATAKAAGTPVKVPGVEGLWAKPEGGMTTTPRLIMPGTDVASATPASPTPPPVGPITTPPPAAQPPAPPAAQPPAAQPPAPVPAPTDASQRAPVRDLSQIKPTDMTEQEWKRYYQHDPTPEELTQRGLVIPGNEAEAQAAARGVQEAETAAAAAQHAANLAMQPGYNQSFGTVADLMKQNNAAQEAAQKAREKYADVLQDTTKTNAAALQKYYTEQDTANAASYKAQVTDPKAAAIAQQAQLEREIQLEKLRQTGAQNLEVLKGQTLADTKVMDTLNETQSAAQQAIDQTHLARSLSQASGDPTFWQMMQQSHPETIKWLANAGALPEETVKQLGTANAMDAAFNKLITMARFGTGFSRPTNLDVQILTSQAPAGTDPQAWREAKLAYMESYMQRENDFVNRAYAYRSQPGTSWHDAQQKARADMPDIVPQMDRATANAGPDARKAWASSLPANTFFRDPDGKLVIWPGAGTATTAAPTRSRGPNVGYGNQ